MNITLPQVFDARQEIIDRMIALNDPAHPMIQFFDRVKMDEVVVIPDLVAKNYFTANIVLGSHFVPGGLPGMGCSVGDFFEHGGESYMSVHGHCLLADERALHMLRPHESLYRRWHEKMPEFRTRISASIDAMQSLNDQFFGNEALAKRDEWNSSYVGWGYVGTPNPTFLAALRSTAEACKGVDGGGEIAETALRLADELDEYVGLRDLLSTIRQETGHKSFPVITNGMLGFRTPAASGGASHHSHVPDDDILGVIPGNQTITIIAGQAGTIPIAHMGGGSLQGEHYIFLQPRENFFSEVQRDVDASDELRRTWETGPDMKTWNGAMRPTLESAIRRLVPGFAANRVLGMHVDLVSEKATRTAHMRPVIAEAGFAQWKETIDAQKATVVRKEWKNCLIDVGDKYALLPPYFE